MKRISVTVGPHEARIEWTWTGGKSVKKESGKTTIKKGLRKVVKK